MSKTVTMTKQELMEYAEVFRQISAVAKGDTEDREAFMRFKYAVGRNAANFNSMAKQIAAEVRATLREEPAYSEFIKARETIALKHCVKDDKGEPVIDVAKDGSESWKFSEDGEKAAREESAAHPAIQRQKQIEDAAAKAMLEPVEMALYTVPWSCAPERVSGEFLAAIMPMFTEVPAEVLDAPVDAPVKAAGLKLAE